jgi:hypothetical protein
MKKPALTVLAILLMSITGCIRTYRAEQYSSVNSSLNSDGTASLTRQANHEERSWTGPWLAQPDSIRP